MWNFLAKVHNLPLLLRAAFVALAAMVLISSLLSSQDHLQSAVNQQMKGAGGTAIVSDPRTGRVLAVWNRKEALERRFPPGSTAKLVTSAVALENNVITPEEKLYCRRVPRLLGEAFRCSHADPLEPFTLVTALANSCNYFFSELSTRIDAAMLMRGYSLFGLGPHSRDHDGGFRIPSDPKAKARAALGEMPVLVSPAELLMAYSAVATRGAIYELQESDTHPARVRRTVRARRGAVRWWRM